MITADRPEGTTESLTRPNTAAMSPCARYRFAGVAVNRPARTPRDAEVEGLRPMVARAQG